MVLEDGTRHRTTLEDPDRLRGRQVRAHDPVAQPGERVPAHRARRAANASCGIEELQRARRGAAKRRASRRTTRSWRSTRSSPIPVACFVFAMLGLALGASNRKDGKLAAFVLGIARDLRLLRDHVHGAVADQGVLDPGVAVDVAAEHRARRRRRAAADVARALGRPADSHSAAARGWSPACRQARDARPPRAPQAGAGATRRPVLVLRVPHFELPRPTLLDGYIAKQYLRILAMTTVGMLGLFYISTFIDMSDKLFKGQTTLGDDRRVPVLVDARVPDLHHRARGAALGARHRRPADQEQRADRDARVRHQPVSHGPADGGVRARRQRGPVRHGRARAGHRQPARRAAEAPDPHRVAADLRRRSTASGSSATTATCITTSITTRATTS